jgi:hypothetical protein
MPIDKGPARLFLENLGFNSYPEDDPAKKQEKANRKLGTCSTLRELGLEASYPDLGEREASANTTLMDIYGSSLPEHYAIEFLRKVAEHRHETDHTAKEKARHFAKTNWEREAKNGEEYSSKADTVKAVRDKLKKDQEIRKPYSDRTIWGWIKDLAPESIRRPGLRKK